MLDFYRLCSQDLPSDMLYLGRFQAGCNTDPLGLDPWSDVFFPINQANDYDS